jgi:hypothetical protein
VDAAVTVEDISACLEACTAHGAEELHVLGWTWPPDVAGPGSAVADHAAEHGVRLILRQIPREVMEPAPARITDADFFELRRIAVDVMPTGRPCELVVELRDFLVAHPELVPAAVRTNVQRWSDYVDYWAVDWCPSDDTFRPGWTAYRTRADRSLALRSAPHRYPAPGRYRLRVQVIDIFGHETSQLHDGPAL